MIRKVIFGGGLSFALTLIGMVGGVLANIVLSRSLGPAAFGTYSIALATAMIVAILCAGGLDASVVRVAPEQFAARTGLRTLARFVAATQGALHFAAAAFLLLAFLLAPRFFGLSEAWDVVSIVVIAFCSAMLTAQGMFFRSGGMLVMAQLYQHPIRSFLLAGLALAATVKIGKFGPSEALGLTAVAIALVWLASTVHYSRLIARNDDGGAVELDRRRILAFGLAAVVAGTFQQVGTHAPVFLLGALGTQEQAGLFAVVTRLTVLISAVTTGVATFVCPSIVIARRDRDWPALASLVRASAWLSFGCAVGAALFLAVVGEELLALFGAEFRAAYPALVVLSVFVALSMASGVAASLLSMTDHEEQVPLGVALGLAVHLPLAFWLIPIQGAAGAAFAAGAGLLACNIYWAAQARRLVGIDCTVAAFRHAAFARSGGRLSVKSVESLARLDRPDPAGM